MMKCIIIDDEQIAIERLQKLLQDVNDLEIISTFTITEEALMYLKAYAVDAVFLDINMPVIDGLEFTSRIKESGLRCEIIFTTGYSEYAIEAFELNALDYLLKPIRKERLSISIERLRAKVSELEFEISIFGQADLRKIIGTKTGDIQKVKWRTTKTQELFWYLYLHQGQDLLRISLIDSLWPDFPDKRALSNLNTTLYYLKQNLSEFGVPFSVDSSHTTIRLQLNSKVKEFNINTLREHIKKWNQLSMEEKTSIVTEKYLHRLFEQFNYVWCMNLQEEAEELYETLVELYVKDSEKIEDKIKIYQGVTEFHPISEGFYYKLIQLYLANNDDKSAKKCYARLAKNLKDELGTIPSFTFRTN